MSLGDADGDGVLEVLFGTFSGRLWALRGDTGQVGGKVLAPVLPVKLLDKRPGLQLVVSAGDGRLYAVDGVSGG